MNCSQCKEQLVEYIEGLLDDAQRSRIETHLAKCKRCRAELKDLSAMHQRLTSRGKNFEQIDLEDKVVNRLIREQKQKLEQANRDIRRAQVWRIIMHSRITKLTAAAAIIIVAIFVLAKTIDYGVTPAYAVAQTVEAIKNVYTVYMRGEFYKQGDFECWMKYDRDGDSPTHMRLGQPGKPVYKICSPEGIFVLNSRTNVVLFATRDERDKIWYPNFNDFLVTTIEEAQKKEQIEIVRDIDPETQREVILLDINSPKRQQRFIIDSANKLPISFETIRDDVPMEMIRRPLQIKSLNEIVYNEKIPEENFKMPPDAQIADKEIDCLVYPEAGILVDEITLQQACIKIVKIMCQAVINNDYDTLSKYLLLPVPIEIWKMRPENLPVPVELLSHDEPYQQGEFWYVPLSIKLSNGAVENTTPMIKFYEFDGKKYGFVVGTKEKGLID